MTVPDIVYELPKRSLGMNARHLVFAPTVLRTFYAERQLKASQCESGGQLFGRFEEDRVTVIAATTPSPDDQRSRFRLTRAQSTEQAEIDQAYANGDHYLGDWHTHPEPIPTPSCIDNKVARQLYRTSKSELRNFLMVIIGTSDAPHDMYVALVNGRRLRPLVINTDD